MQKRTIAAIGVLTLTEVVLPACVFGYMWYNGFAITLTSFIDGVYEVHRIPVDWIARGLYRIDIPIDTGTFIATNVMSLVEIVLMGGVGWLLLPFYRQGRALVQAEWNKE